MRTILLFIVLSNHCFCQIQKHKTSLNYPEITNSILPGDWYLKETNLIPANHSDSIKIIGDSPTASKTITFTKDSLIIHPHTSRYYIRTVKYAYTIEDSNLQLYLGKGKKRKEFAAYRIIKCSPRELIIAKDELLTTTFDRTLLTIYYVYHRKELDSEYTTLLSRLHTEWITCSDNPIPFLNSDTNVVLKLRKEGVNLEQNSRCAKSFYKISITFTQDPKTFQNTFQSYSTTGNAGVLITSLPFYFDRYLENIIFLGTEYFAYKIVLDSNQLTLTLNKKLTEQLNKKSP